MQRTLFLMMLLAQPFVFSQSLLAQDPPEQMEVKAAAPAQKASPCPKLAVKSASPQIVREGNAVTFVAEMTGGDPNVVPTILWSVNGGIITDGQGTKRVQVDSAGAGATRQLAAELWLGGYPPECSNTALASVRVAGPATLVDQFGELAADQASQRAAAAVDALSHSNDRLVVIVYAGRGSVRGYANTAGRRLTSQFEKSEVPAGRVRTMDGGFREEPAYEFWIVPEGADAPRPTPTVDRKELVSPPRTTSTRKP